MSQAITQPVVYLNITDANTQPTAKQIQVNKEKHHFRFINISDTVIKADAAALARACAPGVRDAQ